MKSRLLDLNAWKVVFAVAKAGSMNRAAADLECDISAISRTIQALETDLGMALFVRDKRHCVLTQQGLTFVNALGPQVKRFRATLNDLIQEDTSSGKVFVSLPSGLSQPFLKWFSEFQKDYPKVQIEVHTTNALFEDEQIDIAVLARKTNSVISPSFVDLGILSTGIFVSRHYQDTHGLILSIADLTYHKLITNSNWACPSFIYDSCGQAYSHGAAGSLRVDSMNLLISSVLDHLGVGLGIPLVMAEPFVAKGDLIRVLPAYETSALNMALFKPREANTSKIALKLFEFIRQRWQEEKIGTSSNPASCCVLKR